jgi:hypothetical protein
MLKFVSSIAAFLLSACALAQNVNVSSPIAGTTVADPFNLTASCKVAHADAMQVYLDSSLVYTANAPSMNAYINASPGNHRLEVKCWVNTSAYSSGIFSFTVAREAGTDQVPVASPFVNATVGTPFSVIAGCNIDGADALQIYLDSSLVYSASPTSVNQSLSASPGNHQLEVQCWSGGTSYSSGEFGITVAAQTGANPVIVSSPLSNAAVGTTFSAIASCNVRGADAMQAYLDSTLVYEENVTSMNANLTASIGKHELDIKCWAGDTAYSTGNYQFAVGPEGGTRQVIVSSPLPGTTEAPTFNVTANCNLAGADVIQVYLDGTAVYSPNVTAINYLARASPGVSHRLEVKCWVQGTPYSSGIFVIDPADTNNSGFDRSPDIPIPPSFAYYADNVQNFSDWTSTTGAGANCPDGVPSSTCDPPNAKYNLTVEQVADPAPLAGSSYTSGLFQLFDSPPWINAVWINNLFTSANVHNLIWDLYVYVDSTNYNGSELDLYTTGNGGQTFMLGSFCNRPGNMLDTWDTATQTWIHNKNIHCGDIWTANAWHHVTFYATVDTSSNSYTYHVFRFDNVDYVLNQTEHAGGSGWPNGDVGIQVQLDTNASGRGVNQWLENVQLYAW